MFLGAVSRLETTCKTTTNVIWLFSDWKGAKHSKFVSVDYVVMASIFQNKKQITTADVKPDYNLSLEGIMGPVIRDDALAICTDGKTYFFLFAKKKIGSVSSLASKEYKPSQH